MLEVLTVLMVMGVLSMLVLPRVGGFIDASRLRTAADTIRRQLLAAKVRAVANPNVHCGVYVDTAAGRSLAFFDNGASSRYVYDAAEDAPYGGTGAELPPGIHVSFTPSGGAAVNAIVFRGDGSAKYGGSFEVRSAGGKRLVVRVLGVTGEVRVLWL